MADTHHPASDHVSRRQARRDAMVILYQQDLTGSGLEELYGNLEKDRGHSPVEFTRSEVEDVLKSREELDAVIDAASRGWPAHRMAALERNILRIAVYEIKSRPDIAIETSIDEAVTLAKRYCSREAGALVNGILSKVTEEGQGRR